MANNISIIIPSIRFIVFLVKEKINNKDDERSKAIKSITPKDDGVIVP